MSQSSGCWLYLIAVSSNNTHIGVCTDPFDALVTHNDGRVRDTKAWAGSWQHVLLIFVPDNRQLDAEHLARHWRTQNRLLQHRLVAGIQLAAKLLLLCYADMSSLRNQESSVPEIKKALRKVEQTAASQIDSDNIVRRVKLYLETPSAVYSARHPSAVTIPPLDHINTLCDKSGRSICFSSGAADGAGDESIKPTKRAKKSMAVVNSIVRLQQSTTFNDDAGALLAPVPDDTQLSAAARRRQRTAPLVSSVDPKMLSRYGDALCADMYNNHTLANMKRSDGQEERRCVCGTARDTSAAIDVVLAPSEAATTAYLCATCGRSSATYERYSIDSARATTQLGGEAADVDEQDVTSDSLDLFLETLLVSFTGDVSSPKRTLAAVNAKRVAENSTARKRLEFPEGGSLLVYNGTHQVACEHASLTQLAPADPQLVGAMI